MITALNQRWREGRDSYRPSGELIRTSAYEVGAIKEDRIAKAFVVGHHYSGSYPAARFRFGLYRRGVLEGTAVFSVPGNDRALACLPGSPRESVELGRFVLLDSVPGNGETWFLARCFEQLRAEGLIGVVSFSDPLERTTASGARVFGGHVGTIYQAFNARYLGRSKADTLRLLPDGRTLTNRTLAKIRKRDRGWRYSAQLLEAHGADPLHLQDPIEWLAEWLPKLTRKIRHPGNHKYAWTLQRRDRRHLPQGLEYPKLHLQAAA